MNDDQLQLYLQQIISDVHAGIAKTNLTKPEQVEKLKGEIQKQLKRFDVAVDQIVPQIIADEFFGGIDGATKALVDEAIDAGTGLALGAGGVISEEFRQPVYLDALDEIMNDTFGDLRAARRTAEISALDTIDDTIANVKGEIAKGTIKGDPRKVMQEEVMTKFREGGLTSFITEPDINGIRRRLPLDFYAMLVTRTKMRDAGVTGATKRYTEAGQDLVKITERADTCLICGRFRGMVVSLTGETEGFPAVGENGISLPPYHPNCRGTISVYVLKRKTPEEIEEIKAHNAKYNQTDDRRTERQRKGYNKEQQMRRVANAEKKQFMAWNDELGAENFKTLGAFRRAKKGNTLKFQELGSQFRTAKAGKRLPNGSKAAARAEAAAKEKAKREAEKLAAAKAAKAAKAKAKREAAKAEAAAKAKAEAKAAAEAERRAQGKAAVERMRAAAAGKAKTPAPAATATTPSGFITDTAQKRFEAISKRGVPDMSTNPKRKKYAQDLLDDAGLGHLKMSYNRSKGANGSVSYFEQNGKIETVKFNLKSDDNRSAAYKLNTLHHEFYHANYHGLDRGRLGNTARVSLEETATETAAAYMTKAKGSKDLVLPAYPAYMNKNLPQLKKLDEFKDCIDIEDFGAVFMKYRFDPAHKTADWMPLNDKLEKLGKFDVIAYNKLHYHDYISKNIEDIAIAAAKAMDESYLTSARHMDLIRNEITKGIEKGRVNTSYELSIMYAMKMLGVK